MSQEGYQLMKDMPLIRYHLLILWVLPLGRQILYSDTTMCHKEKHYKHRNHSMLQLSNLKLKKWQATRKIHVYWVLNFTMQPQESSPSASVIPLSHTNRGWHGTLTTGSTRIWPFIPHHWVNARLLLFTQPSAAKWSSLHSTAVCVGT